MKPYTYLRYDAAVTTTLGLLFSWLHMLHCTVVITLDTFPSYIYIPVIYLNVRIAVHAQLAKHVLLDKMSSRGKYRSYTVKLKLEVVDYTLNHSKAAARRKYGVHRKLVQTERTLDYFIVEKAAAWRWDKYSDIDQSCIAGYWNSVKAVTELVANN